MKPYPAYKDSGVEWLGMVPEGWEVKRLKAELQEIDIRAGGQRFELLGLSKTLGIVPRSALSQGAADSDDYGKYKVVRCGDLVMNKMQAWNGVFGLSPLDGIVSPDYSVFHVRRPAYASFITEALRTDVAAGEMFTRCRGMGTAFLRLNTSDFLDVHIALPPTGDVEAIAAFLDRETAKIDGLIEEQRRLIALLAEKRQAIICHAVTRGLNPSARLKPSGVDWLGDIPEGWKVVPIRKVARLESGHTPSRSRPEWWVDCYIPWFSLADIWQVRSGQTEYVHETAETVSDLGLANSSARLLPAGTVMLSRTASVGFSAIMGVPMATTQDFANWVCGASLDPEFLLYCLRAMKPEFDRLKFGSTHNTIYMPDIRSFTIGLPSVEYQTRIVSHIRTKIAELDELTETATTAITLLQERRAALISAAVTGKIDVREVAKVSARTSQSLHVSAMVAGVIIACHGQHVGFGRMMVQKFLFMAQACANAPEIGGDYERQAAGPLDRDLQNRVETDLEAAGLVRVRQEGGPGSRVQYEFLGDATTLRAELASALGDRMERFDYLSDQLGGLSKNGIEAVATLYAAWNDLLIDGRTPDRADIVREVLKNWHPEKSRKFTTDELGTWLDWMERRNIVPDGTGPQTHTGRLFP